MQLTTVEFSQPTARFDIVSIDGHYEGTIKEDGSEIVPVPVFAAESSSVSRSITNDVSEMRMFSREKLLSEFLQPQLHPVKPWRCPDCSEMIEGQFTACWKCGGSP